MCVKLEFFILRRLTIEKNDIHFLLPQLHNHLFGVALLR